MSEWKGNSSAQELRIGDIQAVAGVNGTAIVYASVERTAPRQLGMDAAKTAAEQALREMHDALSAHFAPVLRWSDNRAELLGCWELSVGEQPDGLWWWTTMLGGDFGEDGGDCTTAANARRAAETSLRGFGVVFRVEGE